MGNKAVVILVLTVLQVVSSKNLNSDAAYAMLEGYFQDLTEPRTVNVRLDIHGEKITNITTLGDLNAGNVTIETLDGGVGYDYVHLSYEATADALGYFSTSIYTTEPAFITDQIDRISDFSNDQPLDSDEFIQFSYAAVHHSSNSPRTDNISFSFDNSIEYCSGNSYWSNGNGSREIQGGHPDNFFNIVLHIPEGVSGSSSYQCESANTVKRSRQVASVRSLQDSRDKRGLLQLYDTILGDFGNRAYAAPYEILSYEGTIHWKNGTGQWNVSGEGVGFSGIEIAYENPQHAYGFLDFDLVVKEG